jgi:hypothetical protein
MTKKAHGVFYTPQPIVEYIVRNTLAPLLDGRSPMQLAGRFENGELDHNSHPLTILDPACGTGHFLLGVYQHMLDWCLQWYCEHDSDHWAKGPTPTIICTEQTVGLRPEERQRILREHIFGVDIDEQAIEIAKRSLLAKMFDSPFESDEEAFALVNQIRCGNSLIRSDFEKTSQHEVRTAIRTFDWEVEFATVMASGGFDAIVGNPPYVNARLVKQEQGEPVKRYFRQHYRCARRAFDLYVLFVERSHDLLRDGGRAGMIVPNKIATLDYAQPCRELLLQETTLDTITDVSSQETFRDASVYPYIITWTKLRPVPTHSVRIVTVDETKCLSQAKVSRRIRQAEWSAEAGFNIHETIDVEARVSTRPLNRCATIHSGTTGFSAERMANALQEQDTTDGGHHFEFIVSGNIDRYSISSGNVRFIKRLFKQPVLSTDSEVLTESKRNLFANAKIVIAGMSRRLEAAFDSGGLALGVQVYAVARFEDDPRFLLGLLNSKLMSYLLCTRFQAKRLAGGYLAINKGQLAKLPIRHIDEGDAESVSLRDGIASLVDGLKRAGGTSDGEIDRLVYQLYALTDDEVETVELAVPSELSQVKDKHKVVNKLGD